MARKRLLTESKEKPKRHEPSAFAEKTGAFVERHERKIVVGFTIALLLLPLLVSVLFRAPTYWLPVTQQWAKSSVDANIQNSIGAQISQQYPNLPSANKQQLVTQQYQKALADPATKKEIDSQITQTAAYFKSQLEDSNGHTLLPDIDTYYNLLKVEQIVKNGYPGDKVVDGVPWNMHMLAPLGVPTNWDAYTTFTAYVYKAETALGFQTTPMYTLFWMPLLFAALAVIPAFFMGWREGLFAGFFAALLLAVHPSYITQSAAGYASTHVLQLFFPITIAWLFLEAFEAGTWLKRSIWLVASGLVFGLFALTWGYWWFFFDIFLIVVVSYFIYQVLRHFLQKGDLKSLARNKEVTWSLIMLAGFLIVDGLFIALFVGLPNFIQGPVSAFAVTADFKAAAQAGQIWPNVLTTVAELNQPSIADIVNATGGELIFILGLMGMLFSLVPRKELRWKDWTLLGFGLAVFLYLTSPAGTSLSILWFLAVMGLPVIVGGLLLLKDDRAIDVKYAIFIAVWLAASIFTMTKGVRFIIMVLPPLIVGAAISAGAVYSILKDWLVGHLNLSKAWVVPALFVILSLALIPITIQGYQAGQQSAPIITKPWYDTLTNIKQNTAPDAIINSWWDFGHWFKDIADRRVTFDGASQMGSDAHWIGEALLTPNETEALGILRMMDCGNYQGAQDVQDGLPGHDQYQAIMLTKRIIMMPPAQAHQTLLANGLSEEQAQTVLNHTVCQPPDDYFITSGDMVGKGGVWGHFGSWNFTRADAYVNFRAQPQDTAIPAMAAKYNLSEADAKNLYYQLQTLGDQTSVNNWIAPWPGYPSSSWSNCVHSQQNDSVYLCTLNVQVGQQQGVNIVLNGFVLNESAVNRSFVSLGFYNAQGQLTGQNNDVRPTSIVLALNGTVETVETGGTLGESFLVDLRDPANPRVLLTAPENAGSLFTRLFFLDGDGTGAFQKFSDVTDFMGTRIIVWKVDWSKMQALGLA